MNKISIAILTDIEFWHEIKDGGQYGMHTLIEFYSDFTDATVFYIGYLPHNQKKMISKHYNVVVETPPISIKIFTKYVYHKFKKYSLIRFIKNVIFDYILKKNSRKIVINQIDDLVSDWLNKSINKIKLDGISVTFVWNTNRILNFLKTFEGFKILDTVDIIYLRNESYIAANKKPYIVISKETELEMMGLYDVILVVQDQEKKYIEKNSKNKVIVTRRPFDIDYIYKLHNNKKLKILFFGGDSDFNINAYEWFIEECWYKYDLFKRYDLVIAGLVTTKINPNHIGVFDRGILKRAKDAYIDIDVVINPIRFGAGIKIKNCEALSYGMPLITTPIGAEGLITKTRNHISLCITPDDYCKELEKMKENNYRIDLSKAAIQYAIENFSINSCYAEIKEYVINNSIN